MEEVGILCSYVPVELLMAAGLMPVRILPETLSQRGAVFLDTNYCPYILNTFSEGLDGKYDSLSGLIFANSCDGMRRLYDTWRKIINKPKFIYFMNLPFSTNKIIFLQELEKLIKSIEKAFSTNITESRLQEAIKEANKQRKNSLKHIKNKTNSKKLIVSGTILNTDELQDILGETTIIHEDLCNSNRYLDMEIKETKEPLTAIAEAYMKRIQCPRMCSTIDRAYNLLRIAKESEADGVILYGLKFCDTFLFSAPRIKKELKEHGIPVLMVDGLFRPASFAGLKTRLQAFLEML